MMAFLYITTGLLVVSGLIVIIAIIQAFRSGQVDEWRRQHWQTMLETAQKELEKDANQT